MAYDDYLTACYESGIQPVSREQFDAVNGSH